MNLFKDDVLQSFWHTCRAEKLGIGLRV